MSINSCKSTAKSAFGNFERFDHVELFVGNAKQAASYYVTRLGFSLIAYKGLETGSRDITSYVVSQGQCILVFTSAVRPGNDHYGCHITLHGDAVKNVAFRVESSRIAYEAAIAGGAISVLAPVEESDKFGTVVLASIQAMGDTIHTFVERQHYEGIFLPGFVSVFDADPLSAALPPVGAFAIDHLGFNLFEGEMLQWAAWYEKVLGFHRFFSIDDSIVHTEFSGLRSIVMADRDQTVKIPLIEPARGKKKSQIEEFLEFNGGVGGQHMALSTPDIIVTAQALQARGTQILPVPEGYYKRVQNLIDPNSPLSQFDLLSLIKMNIMVDYNADGSYLLQLFTKPVSDRPTFFIEFIQRYNHLGFGANNFKTIFEAIEQEQNKRGNSH
ncbi:MAG: 4-hydroxyphenylpyruvate dioxygenase [Microcoleus sp.]